MYYSGWTVGKTFSKDELETLAKEKLNEDPNRREADIRSIKDWMSKQPHLKDHGRKGKVEKIYKVAWIPSYHLHLQ